jgi:hypothetical protein
MSDDSAESEDIVVSVTKRRWNETEKRLEWLVTWNDGGQTWEPKESFVEDNGPVNVVWLKFEEEDAAKGNTVLAI